MPATQMIHARIDPRLKCSAEAILSRLGLSASDAIRLFLLRSSTIEDYPSG